jgi:hypothetical protein
LLYYRILTSSSSQRPSWTKEDLNPAMVGPMLAMAGDKLVSLMDDPNAEIRTAAICALRGPLPPQALTKLKKVVDDVDPPQAMPFVFDTIGQYKGREACEVLAGFLGAALEDRDKAKYLANAVMAFDRASGKRFMEAGAHDVAFYRNLAKAALAWWRDEGRRTFSEEGGP